MNIIDHILPFIGAIVDCVCGEIKDDTVTLVLKMYIDLINGVCAYEKRVQWNRRSLLDLGKQIKKLKLKGMDVFWGSTVFGNGDCEMTHIGSYMLQYE